MAFPFHFSFFLIPAIVTGLTTLFLITMTILVSRDKISCTRYCGIRLSGSLQNA